MVLFGRRAIRLSRHYPPTITGVIGAASRSGTIRALKASLIARLTIGFNEADG